MTGWLPSTLSQGIFSIKYIPDIILFSMLYIIISGTLYFFIRYRLVSKEIGINTCMIYTCIFILIIQNSAMICLHAFGILVSKNSLFLTIPISLLITFIFIEICTQISRKKKV